MRAEQPNVFKLRTARDPHHFGECEWGWDEQYLWHRSIGQSKWTRVNRISFTAARVLIIAELLKEKGPG
jgi:hypothetical protein